MIREEDNKCARASPKKMKPKVVTYILLIYQNKLFHKLLIFTFILRIEMLRLVLFSFIISHQFKGEKHNYYKHNSMII